MSAGPRHGHERLVESLEEVRRGGPALQVPPQRGQAPPDLPLRGARLHRGRLSRILALCCPLVPIRRVPVAVQLLVHQRAALQLLLAERAGRQAEDRGLGAGVRAEAGSMEAAGDEPRAHVAPGLRQHVQGIQEGRLRRAALHRQPPQQPAPVVALEVVGDATVQRLGQGGGRWDEDHPDIGKLEVGVRLVLGEEEEDALPLPPHPLVELPQPLGEDGGRHAGQATGVVAPGHLPQVDALQAAGPGALPDCPQRGLFRAVGVGAEQERQPVAGALALAGGAHWEEDPRLPAGARLWRAPKRASQPLLGSGSGRPSASARCLALSWSSGPLTGRSAARAPSTQRRRAASRAASFPSRLRLRSGSPLRCHSLRIRSLFLMMRQIWGCDTPKRLASSLCDTLGPSSISSTRTFSVSDSSFRSFRGAAVPSAVPGERPAEGAGRQGLPAAGDPAPSPAGSAKPLPHRPQA
ncbi:hypothetical protein QYF61_001522 [Mycteria americana]|uniref:Uncharacterized protein n=1 Tax=Mycteria americana TaxID=33587 RepID=A0AAN7NJT2_MYCAM|nr:hypothetical protein QYF61_001522 [Mycteria americana]